MTRLFWVAVALFLAYVVYGWVYVCCPGVSVCGGCEAMNWERLLLVFAFIAVIVPIGILLYTACITRDFIRRTINSSDNLDDYSTNNPERDYADNRDRAQNRR